MKPGDVGYPEPSTAVATTIMRANRPTETGPEMRIRSALHRAGHRFRKNVPLTIGQTRTRPDVVFGTARVAVFVDGCFWHRCPEHGSLPKANSDYWLPKLARNVERDRRVDVALRESGWTVVRVWEHESPEAAVARISKTVEGSVS